MDKPYYKGSYSKDAANGKNRRWIIGKFMDDAPRRNDHVGVKYWEFVKGEDTKHPPKASKVLECTFILHGRVRGMIDSTEIELQAGDYVVISPNIPNNLVEEILEDTTGITINAPSDPLAKTVISKL